MTNEEALTIIEKSEKCYTEDCPDGIFCDECPWNVKHAEFDEAIKTIKHALSKQCASSEQADKKLFGHGYSLFPGEVFISHNVLNEVLDTITKSINTEQRKMDSTLVKTATNDEAIRTDDHIADSDKMDDQFREATKKTDDVLLSRNEVIKVVDRHTRDDGTLDDDISCILEEIQPKEDVPDTNVGKTDFQPGDKFILELGQERRMFGEFEIKGTDLYVKTDLLTKLTRYEPEEKLDSAQPEIIHCKDCKYAEGVLGAIWCNKNGGYYNPAHHFCGMAERRNDG